MRRGLPLLAIGVGSLMLPVAAALTISAGREGDLFVVTVTSEEDAELDIVVSHEAAGSEVVDHVAPVRLRAGELSRVEIPGLPEGPSYVAYAAPRGEVVAGPSPSRPTTAPTSTPLPVGSPPSLASVAHGETVTVTVQPTFQDQRSGRSATVFAPDGPDLIVVRENVEGAVEAVISHDGGQTFGVPILLSGASVMPGGVRVYWDETRFADGTIGIAFRQFEYQEPLDGSRDWTLVRIDLSSERILARQTLAFDTSQVIEGESLEVFTLPNGRTMLLAETKDLRSSYTIDAPSAIHVWTLTAEGARVEETQVPLAHGILPRFETMSTVDGLLRLAWTHGATASDTARQLWTTTSTDGGKTFSPPSATGLPFPASTRPHLGSAEIGPDGTIHAVVFAQDPSTDSGVPFYVRVPVEGAATTLDLTSLPHAHATGEPMIRGHVTVAGDRVLAHWFGGGSFVAESLDGGATFGSVMRLQDQHGSGFVATDADVAPDGGPIYMTTSERCFNCFGRVFPGDLVEFGHWGTSVVPYDSWGPSHISILTPTFPPPPPRERFLPPPEAEPMRPTPGLAPMIVLVALGAIAILARRRSE